MYIYLFISADPSAWPEGEVQGKHEASIRCSSDSTASLASLCIFLACLGQPVHVYGVPATSFTFRLRHAFYSGFEGALSAACVGVANAALFGFPELGFRWCLAFSDPLPTSFLFASVADELHHSGCAMFRARHA